MTLFKVDALIVGGGTTGLSLGIGLLKEGKTVLIAEKHLHSYYPFFRALLLDSSSLKLLVNSGLDVQNLMKRSGIKIDGITIHNDVIEQKLA